jgi:hypothetical protein
MKTKTKKITLIIASLMIVFCSFAQVGIRGGIVGGVVTGPVKLENLGNRFTDVIYGNNISGFEAGVFLKPYIGSFYIKPQALYQFTGGNVNYYTESTTGQQTAYFSMHKVEVPVLVGFNILGPLYIEAGPSYNYIFGVTSSYSENTVAINQSALGYRVGVGAELGPVLLSVNMAGATYMATNDRATFKEPYKFIFGLGFFLGGGDHKKSDKKHESRSKRNDDSDTDKKNDSDSRKRNNDSDSDR